jgi:hypothetical protein
MLAIDLNADAQPEVVNLSGYPLNVYSKVGGEWKKVGVLTSATSNPLGLADLARAGRVRTEPYLWRELILGEAHYSVQPAR